MDSTEAKATASVIDDLKSLRQKIRSGEPIEATRVNLETGEQNGVVLRSRPDLDKLAAETAAKWVESRFVAGLQTDICKAIAAATAPLEQRVRELEQELQKYRQAVATALADKSEAKQQIESERAQWVIELAKATDQRLAAERRLALLESAVAHAPLDD